MKAGGERKGGRKGGGEREGGQGGTEMIEKTGS